MKHRAFLAQLAGRAVLALTLTCTVGQANAAGPVITDLGTLPGGSFSTSGGINAQGQVAGTSASSVGDRAFLYDNGPLQNLGTLGGNRSSAHGIDAASRVVGRARTVQGRFHAFLWDAVAGMVDLGTLPGGTSSTGYSINSGGQIVGESNFLNSPFAFRAFLWTSQGGMVDLGTLSGGSFSVAYSINEAGQVAGEGSLKARNTRREPRVGLSIVDFANPYREAQIRGRVVERRPDARFMAMDRIARKYTGKDFPWRDDAASRVVLVIEVERVRYTVLPFTHTPPVAPPLVAG